MATWSGGTVVTGIAGQPFTGALQIASQTVNDGAISTPVTAGGTINVSGYVYVPGVSGATSIYAGVETTDGAGANDTITNFTIPNPVAGTWTPYSGTITLPSTASKGRLLLTATGGTAQFAEVDYAPQVGAGRIQALAVANSHIAAGTLVGDVVRLVVQCNPTGAGGAAAGWDAVSMTADQCPVFDASNHMISLNNLSLSCNIFTNAAGPNSGENNTAFSGHATFAIWLIYNPTTATAALLASHSFSTPDLSNCSGYTHYFRIGAASLNGSNSVTTGVVGLANAVQTQIQWGQAVSFFHIGNALPPSIINGTASGAGQTSFSLATCVPATARFVILSCANIHASQAFSVAPSSSYSKIIVTGFLGAPYANIGPGTAQIVRMPMLTAQTAYYYNNATANVTYVNLVGYEDNIAA